MILMIAAVGAVASPALPPPDTRQMIRDAMVLVERHGNAVWPGFGSTPIHLIIVSPATDTLFCQTPTRGFRAAGADPITRCTVQTRNRQLGVDLAASMDFGGEPAMIVIGLPETLGLGRAEWILTLAHESFHQYQSQIPGYAAKVKALGLARGGDDGSWMLNYAFPYAEPALGAATNAMAASALAFLGSTSSEQRMRRIADYVKARRSAQKSVTASQWNYYEFQVGQEGIARWTERTLAAAASQRDPQMSAAAENGRRALVNSLRAIRQQGVHIWKRGAFYEFGAVEAEMLTAMGANWQRTYRRHPFSFGDMLERACLSTQCQRYAAFAARVRLRNTSSRSASRVDTSTMP